MVSFPLIFSRPLGKFDKFFTFGLEKQHALIRHRVKEILH